MKVSLNEISKILSSCDNFCILAHKFPDGDTLGSAFALCGAMQKLNKKAKIVCNDKIPKKFSFLKETVNSQEFDPEFILSMDVADVNLLGEKLAYYYDKVDICIDHHATHTDFAKKSFVDPRAAANCEIIYELLRMMRISIDKNIATCIYTGIATDTGCFKYSNVTAKTHTIAAEMISHGVDFANINQVLFYIKTRAQMALERLVLESMEFFFNGKCAMILLTNEMKIKTGACEDDMEGFASLPRQVEGVLVGITFREKENGYFKVSIRTDGSISAMDIGKVLGGGGHRAAGGCDIDEPLEIAKGKILDIVGKEVSKIL